MAVVNIEKLRDGISQRFACVHPRAELRVKVASNGARHYRVQCLRCGEGRQATPTERSLNVQPKPFDEALREEWWKARNEAYKEAWAAEAQAKKQAWFDEYSEYLDSPGWQAKRVLVLERDKYCCQARLPGCLGAADQVHHMTYAHWWNAPLFELQSVCALCHQRITDMDRAARS